MLTGNRYRSRARVVGAALAFTSPVMAGCSTGPDAPTTALPTVTAPAEASPAPTERAATSPVGEATGTPTAAASEPAETGERQTGQAVTGDREGPAPDQGPRTPAPTGAPKPPLEPEPVAPGEVAEAPSAPDADQPPPDSDSARSPEQPVPAGPAQVMPEHGGTYWAAYVSVGESLDDTALVQNAGTVAELGYRLSQKQVSCDEGAGDALGLPADYMLRAVYFETEAAVQEFERIYPKDLVGTGRVTTFCLD